MHVEEQASRAIYIRLRHRARVLRGLAIGFVALIPLTLAFGAIPYFLAGDMALNETRAALEMRRFLAEPHTKSVEKHDRSAGEPAATNGDPDTTAAPAAAAPPQERPAFVPTAENGQRVASDEALSAAVIRVTAAVLLIALVYVFGGLYRYSMRLASYYDAKADALRLLEAGDQQLEERLSQVSMSGAPGKRAPARSTAKV